MDREAEQRFKQILSLARQHFDEVIVVRRDITAQRAILTLRCEYRGKTIAVNEVLAKETRWYSYYLVWSGKVLFGLDNASDREALRMRYGSDFIHHLQEPIPHLHTEDKQELELTDEKGFADFVEMVLELGGT